MKSTQNAPARNAEFNRSCPVKRSRRTKAEMEVFRMAVYAVCEEHAPLTVRQAYYRLVVAGLIPKTQNAYKGVVEQIGQMRERGELPWPWIVDNVRLMRKPRSYNDLEDLLDQQTALYRKNLWSMQDAYVEIWCESDSAAGVLAPVTEKWDVALMAARGFSSKSFLYETAATMRHCDRRPHLYYFGDLDPSGVHIDRDIAKKLHRYGAGDFHFERVAVTREQVDVWSLPGSPPKKSDSRAKDFKGEAVELEAIPPKELRRLCEKLITQHIDPDALERCRLAEAAEVETLRLVPEFIRGRQAG